MNLRFFLGGFAAALCLFLLTSRRPAPHFVQLYPAPVQHHARVWPTRLIEPQERALWTLDIDEAVGDPQVYADVPTPSLQRTPRLAAFLPHPALRADATADPRFCVQKCFTDPAAAATACAGQPKSKCRRLSCLTLDRTKRGSVCIRRQKLKCRRGCSPKVKRVCCKIGHMYRSVMNGCRCTECLAGEIASAGKCPLVIAPTPEPEPVPAPVPSCDDCPTDALPVCCDTSPRIPGISFYEVAPSRCICLCLGLPVLGDELEAGTKVCPIKKE